MIFTKYISFLVLLCLMACSSSKHEQNDSLPEIQHGNSLMESANQLMKSNKMESALGIYKQAFDQFALIDDVEGKFKSTISMIKALILLSDYERAEILLNSVRAAGNVSNDLNENYELLRIEFFLSKKDFDNVKQLTETSKIEKYSNRVFLLMTTYRIKALQLMSQDYSKELRTLTQALHLIEQEEEAFLSLEISDIEFINFTLGTVRLSEKEFTAAEKHFLEGLSLSKQTGDYRSIGDNLFQLGLVNKELLNFDKSLEYLYRAADVYEVLKDSSGVERIRSIIKEMKHSGK
ncbi:MAG: tetratricopeptide repeat protein [Ignavibacteria bacterium]|nr:tetratricopeptide repeat protein [Ignavibacteria bacterium]